MDAAFTWYARYFGMDIPVFQDAAEAPLMTQGKAIQHALDQLGFDGVEGVRTGKVFELELTDTDETAARERVEAMCQQLLANTVIENYDIEIG